MKSKHIAHNTNERIDITNSMSRILLDGDCVDLKKVKVQWTELDTITMNENGVDLDLGY